MGDEFDADGPVTLKVLVHGTRPIARIDIIKDFGLRLFDRAADRPPPRSVDRRGGAEPGLSWYYVRAIQDDGELAWGSPIWVTRRSAQPR